MLISSINHRDLIDELWFLKRDIVSDGFDQALFRLAETVPAELGKMTIHEYPSGESCWTWIVPEKWICQQGILETTDGEKIIDYQDHPLHVVSYSLPFDGIVSRQELLEHLHVHSTIPDAIPFVFKYYDRDWGLCCSRRVLESLNEDQYRVTIDSRFEPGTMKVGELVVPGESNKTVVVAAHLCHPAMVNDDLTGVLTGLDIFLRLLESPRPYYTYRLILVPETIGTIAFLSHNEHLIPNMVGGLFLEMLGNDSAHALQRSFQPDSQFDRCIHTALHSLDAGCYSAPYRSVINNDERQFNAPGVRVPMLSLSRVEPEDSPTRPYYGYHSSLDSPEIVEPERLVKSAKVVLGLIDAWEKNQYVVNDFKGEIFCSGYGIWIDYRQNPEGHKRLFEIMERCDGERTIADIAAELEISFLAVENVVAVFEEQGLVHYSRHPQPTKPI
jgi:aminopeptidase-like protein